MAKSHSLLIVITLGVLATIDIGLEIQEGESTATLDVGLSMMK